MAEPRRNPGNSARPDPACSEQQTLRFAQDLADIYRQERQRREDLESANALMRAIFNHITDALVAVDADFRIIDANPRFSNLFENDPGARCGGGLLGLLEADGLAEPFASFRSSNQDEDAFHATQQRGAGRELLVHASRIQGENMLFVLQDITARKRAEDLRGEFLSILSHELRTPLNGILGLSRMLFDGDADDEEAREYGGHILDSGKRMLNTINELLNFADVQTALAEAEDVTVPLAGVLDSVEDDLAPLARDRGMRMERSGEWDHAVVLGNARMLWELLRHLVQNALLFGRSGGSVDVGVGRADRGLALTVSDDGVGIPAAELERVFDSFYQVDQYMTRNTEGLGLGLAICKRITAIHDGEIDIRSRLDAGTTVRVWFPEERIPGSEAA